MALSRSQDLLVTSQWSGASLFDLISEHLKAFGVDERVSLWGPAINLRPQAVQALGMAIHELRSNAAKYGAFSENAGSVEVSWRLLTDDEGAQQVELVWDEQMTRLTNPKRPSKRRGLAALCSSASSQHPSMGSHPWSGVRGGCAGCSPHHTQLWPGMRQPPDI